MCFISSRQPHQQKTMKNDKKKKKNGTDKRNKPTKYSKFQNFDEPNIDMDALLYCTWYVRTSHWYVFARRQARERNHVFPEQKTVQTKKTDFKARGKRKVERSKKWKKTTFIKQKKETVSSNSPTVNLSHIKPKVLLFVAVRRKTIPGNVYTRNYGRNLVFLEVGCTYSGTTGIPQKKKYKNTKIQKYKNTHKTRILHSPHKKSQAQKRVLHPHFPTRTSLPSSPLNTTNHRSAEKSNTTTPPGISRARS